MALQSSGQITLDDIRTELGLSQSNVSLGSMSDTAGFSAPDQASDFYGYSNASWTSFSTTSTASNSACFFSTGTTRYHDAGANPFPSTGQSVRNTSSGTGIPSTGWYKDGSGSGDRYFLNTSGTITSVTGC